MKATGKLQILILLLVLLPAMAAATENDTFEETLAVPAGTMLEVDTGSGSIEISARPGRDVTVIGKVKVNRKSFWRRAVDKEEVLAEVLANPPVELEGNRLTIGHIKERSLRKRVSISYVIVVPADTSIDAGTGSGSITVSDIAAPVETRAGSGRLTLENIGGPVRAKAGSGRIRAEQVAGEFRGSTGSGSIYLSQAAPGDVNVSTGSGGIELINVDGALEASAGSGSIRVDGRQQGDWKLGTGSGSITVRLSDDAAFYLDAESRSGGITVDHPLMVEGKISKRHIRGEVRGGGPRLKVDTGSGGIHIK
jgi:hypothetical protein